MAVDANPDALREIAWRAGRKPARGGVENLLCVAGTPDELAEEVGGIADRVTVLLPWGSLLSGVAAPEPTMLSAIRSLCKSGASLEIVMSRDARDHGAHVGVLDARHMRETLPTAYALLGFDVRSVDPMDAKELRRVPTTWARRLASGRPREVWRLVARASSTP